MNKKKPNKQREITTEYQALNSKVWYKDANTIIALITILLSTLVGILSIVNTRNIARLNNEIYVPILEYQFGQVEPGKISINVANRGNKSAQNLTINIKWSYPLDIGNCTQSPPFQELKTINAEVERNITVNLPHLAIGQSFELICEISTFGKDLSSLELDPSLHSTLIVSPTETPNPLIQSAYPPLPPQVNRNYLVEVSLPNKALLVEATADNSKPGIEITTTQSILAYLNPSENQNAKDVSPKILLNALHSQSQNDFIDFCNSLSGQNIVWTSLMVNDVKDNPSALFLKPTNSTDEILIKILEEDNSMRGYALNIGARVNLVGQIKFCGEQNGTEIWIKNAHLQLRNPDPDTNIIPAP